jgi:hypothetical protein
MEIVREMKLRKKIRLSLKDMEEIKAIHKDLPDDLKLKIYQKTHFHLMK